MEIRIYLPSADDTLALGRFLGERLTAGTVLALKGDLGAGKTCLTQGLARGLQVPENMPVTSPTFTLANEYPGRIPLFHLDLYRLDDEEFFLSGLDEYFLRSGVTVLEWAERIAEDLPEPRLEIDLTFSATGGRFATLKNLGPQLEELVRAVSELNTADRRENIRS